jgi:glycosyltransferase involved in cell wall biosynthesis
MRRVLFAGRMRYSSPLAITQANKFDALGNVIDFRVLGSSADGNPPPDRFTLLRRLPLDGPMFYARLPFAIARELRSFRPDAVIAQSPYEAIAALAGRRLSRVKAKVIVEIHGDWHTATRLYGSSIRSTLAPLADRAAAWSVRHVDAVRTVSEFTAGLVRKLGVEPVAIFQAYTETDAFTATPPVPLPEQARLAFVGVLERYKNIDGLAAAWRIAAPQLPGVTLELVGDGRRVAVVEQLLRDVPEQTVWHRRQTPAELSDLFDRSWALVLPSFSEGLPRVVIEVLARGRPVVGSRAGGIPNAITDGDNGLLVPPGDAQALADALVRFASDRALAEKLAARAQPSGEKLLVSPDEYARRVAQLVEDVL